MTQNNNKDVASSVDIHQYYLDIINCMPNIVYWIDLNCELKGCNHNFVKLFGLKQMSNFSGTPYEIMKQWLPWTKEQIKSIKMNDLGAIFSGESKHDEEEVVSNTEGESIYYHASRTPLFDADKQVIGLVVVLVDVTAQKNTQHRLRLAETGDESQEANKPVETLRRILVVEDNQIAQIIEKSMFEELGCIVDVAESGIAATNLFSSGKYAFVLMDISLEDTSGYVVTKSLREMEENTDNKVPIIALTSYQAEKVKDDCHYYTMEGAITKPLSREQAIQIVKRYADNEPIAVEGLKSI